MCVPVFICLSGDRASQGLFLASLGLYGANTCFLIPLSSQAWPTPCHDLLTKSIQSWWEQRLESKGYCLLLGLSSQLCVLHSWDGGFGGGCITNAHTDIHSNERRHFTPQRGTTSISQTHFCHPVFLCSHKNISKVYCLCILVRVSTKILFPGVQMKSCCLSHYFRLHKETRHCKTLLLINGDMTVIATVNKLNQWLP